MYIISIRTNKFAPTYHVRPLNYFEEISFSSRIVYHWRLWAIGRWLTVNLDYSNKKIYERNYLYFHSLLHYHNPWTVVTRWVLFGVIPIEIQGTAVAKNGQSRVKTDKIRLLGTLLVEKLMGKQNVKWGDGLHGTSLKWVKSWREFTSTCKTLLQDA